MKTDNGIEVGDIVEYSPLKISGTVTTIRTHFAGCVTVGIKYENNGQEYISPEIDSFLCDIRSKSPSKIDFDNTVKTGDIVSEHKSNSISLVSNISYMLDGNCLVESIILESAHNSLETIYNLHSNLTTLTDHNLSNKVSEWLLRERPVIKKGDKVKHLISNEVGVALNVKEHLNGTIHITMSTGKVRNYEPITCDVEFFEVNND